MRDLRVPTSSASSGPVKSSSRPVEVTKTPPEKSPRSVATSANKMLELIDILPTSGARAVSYFSIEGSHYLAIPQLAEDIPGQAADMTLGNMDVDMLIYKQDKDGMKLYQRLPTSGGEDAEFFVIGKRSFLAGASLRSGSGPYNFNVGSTIWEWQESKFVLFQSVPTFAAKQWRHFAIDERHFLALAQGVSHGSDSEETHESTIFEWNGSTFVSFQVVPSAWGYNWETFQIDGEFYLAYADNIKPSIILRWNGKEFKHFQTLDGKSGRAFCFFQANGISYLAFANLMGNTLLYHWVQNSFVIHQTLSGPGGREFSLIQDGGETYMIQVNFIQGTREAPKTDLNSVIYRLEGGQLSVVDSFPTYGATDVTTWTVDGKSVVAISQSLSKDVRFRTDSHIYHFKPKGHDITSSLSPPQPNAEFLKLYTTYTGGPDSLGASYSQAMLRTRTNDPLIVATSADLILFPGHGADPQTLGFRLGTKGFKELAAVSHLGPALASLVNMHLLDPHSEVWRGDAEKLLAATENARKANSVGLWSKEIAVEAFRGREVSIAAMIDYACAMVGRFLHAVLDDVSKLTPRFLREALLEASESSLGLSIPFNAVMIATFFLASLDISFRVTRWLKDQGIDWTKTMVLVCGKQGRPTAGVTFSTNSVCQMIHGASNLRLPLEHIYIAPHAPTPSAVENKSIEEIRAFEEPSRFLWCYTRAISDLAPIMFEGYARYEPDPGTRPTLSKNTRNVSEMPKICGPDDMLSMTTRLRIVMEDPRQLLSGCVMDYAVDQLRENGNNPFTVVVPCLDKYEYPQHLPSRDFIRHEPLANGWHPRDLAGYEDRGSVTRTSPATTNLFETHFTPQYNFLKIHRGQIAWWEEGKGETTVLWIHGLPLESRSWELQRRHFSPLCRNIFVDLRGYGRSSKLPADVHGVTSLYCEDLRALIDELKLDKVVLVGFASAGHIALRLAAQLGSRIEKLVTINGSPRFRKGPDWPWGFTDAAIAHFTDALDKNGIEGLTDAVLDPDKVFRDLPRSDALRIATWFRSMSLVAGGETLRGFFEDISRDDDRNLLPKITAPTLIIVGLLGQEVPSEVGLYLRQHIASARLAELTGADHFAFATRPQAVNGLIEDFIISV